MRDRIARAFGNFQDVQNGYISGAERRGADCQEPGLLLLGAERRAGAGKPYGLYRKTAVVRGEGKSSELEQPGMDWGSLEVSMHQRYLLTGSLMPHLPEEGEREVAFLSDRNLFHRFLRNSGNICQQSCFSSQNPAPAEDQI